MFRPSLLLLSTALATPALAQRTTNNAVTASDDAFGSAIGNERIGIYSADEVRGFNPIDAGNARIEGLYFDEITFLINRLSERSSVRVGYASLAWPFPAPTGIVNRQLEKFEGQSELGLEAEVDMDGNFTTTVQAKLALDGDRLGIALGNGQRRSRIPSARYVNFNGQAATLTWRPEAGQEINLFWSTALFAHSGGTPLLFPAGDAPPPQVERRDYIGQPWAHGSQRSHVLGGTAQLTLGRFKLDAGLFRSIRDQKRDFADLALGIQPDGRTVREIIVADRDSRIASVSGEVRLSRVFEQGAANHRITLMLRGRDQMRRYGGQARFDLGATSMFNRVIVPRPALTFGLQDRSGVQQLSVGLGYDLALKGGARLGLSAQKSDYTKRVDFGNPAIPSTQVKDKPLLLAGNIVVPLAKTLQVYASYVEGLEESPNAPDIAVNASEAPPAGRSQQIDFGVRARIANRMTLVAGAFEVEKPYFNLDAARRYGVLGTVRHRGLEASLTGSPAKGLTIVAGALFLDPRISGSAVDTGLIGRRPVGVNRQKLIFNLDWRPKQGTSPWSFDLNAERLAGAAANAANSFKVPARETLGISTRYRFDMAGAKWLARLQVINLFNDYGWRVVSSGGFLFTQPRTLLGTLSTDF